MKIKINKRIKEILFPIWLTFWAGVTLILISILIFIASELAGINWINITVVNNTIL